MCARAHPVYMVLFVRPQQQVLRAVLNSYISLTIIKAVSPWMTHSFSRINPYYLFLPLALLLLQTLPLLPLSLQAYLLSALLQFLPLYQQE